MAQAARVHPGRGGSAAEQDPEAASDLRARAAVSVQHAHAAGAVKVCLRVTMSPFVYSPSGPIRRAPLQVKLNS